MNNQSQNQESEISVGKQLSFAGFLYDQGLKALDLAIADRANHDDEAWGLHSQDMIEAYNAADSWQHPSQRILAQPLTWANKQGAF